MLKSLKLGECIGLCEGRIRDRKTKTKSFTSSSSVESLESGIKSLRIQDTANQSPIPLGAVSEEPLSPAAYANC